jgi:uncharacterized protein
LTEGEVFTRSIPNVKHNAKHKRITIYMRIWIDIVNPSHAFFFKALMKELIQNHQVNVTVRDRSENVALCKELNMTTTMIGRDFRNRIAKTFNVAFRTSELFLRVPKFDVALACGGSMSVAVSKARFKPSIIFDDNEISFSQGTFAGILDTCVEARASYIIMPSACPEDAVIRRGAKKENIYRYDGYKEDVYIADYEPAPDFPKNLPFSKFVVLRPEALFAAYVRETRSITPELAKTLVDNGVNVIYLPRIKEDRQHIEGIKNNSHVFVPPKALNGLDLCWYADAVLTGSGTFAREAACLGTTAVSFFPESLLAVDRQLVSQGKMLHSRNIAGIVAYVLSKPKEDKKLDLERCRKVKRQVSQLVRGILERIG